jgi:predicted nucleic acid-binding protein
VIVVADTSPLRYLILIEHEYVLPALYGRVLVPPAVIIRSGLWPEPRLGCSQGAPSPRSAPSHPTMQRTRRGGPGSRARLWRAYRLSREQTPDIVRQRLSDHPEWLIVQASAEPVGVRRSGLGPGEAAALALALEQSADALLIDDRDARREARDHGLTVLGTLRVLADAADHGFADVRTALNRLRQTNLRASNHIINELLARYRRED